MLILRGNDLMLCISNFEGRVIGFDLNYFSGHFTLDLLYFHVEFILSLH